MFDFSQIKKVSTFYLIGIGGVSMSALALRLKEKGFLVAGTEVCQNIYTDKLKRYGITINNSHHEENINGFDAIVYSSAINSNCPELKEAKRKKLLILSRGELLAYLLSEFKTIIAVAGTHGKTTTTTMIAEIFSAYKPTTVFIGGNSIKFSNYSANGNDTAIVEACEYQRNFLYLHPTDAIILNIDKDHTDCYPTILSAQTAYKQFSKKAYCITNGDDKNCNFLPAKIRFGKSVKNDFYADKIRVKRNKTSFDLYIKGKRKGKIIINAFGEHNAVNSLSAIAIALKYGIPLKTIKKSLKNYKGVARRNEYIGRVSHTRYYADYCHHPKELSTFLKNKRFNKKDLIIFQPHTYSRTKALFNDFVLALNTKCDIAIFKTYPARETFDKQGDGYTLFSELKTTKKEVYYFDKLNELLEKAKRYKRVYILGAGNLYDAIKKALF